MRAASAAPDSPQGDRNSAPKKMPYEYILALGVDTSFSRGSDRLTPLVGFFWYIEDRPKFYGQVTVTTTQVFFIAAYRYGRLFAGVQPLLNHNTSASYRSYNRGYEDHSRSIRGNSAGAVGFVQYAVTRLLSARVTFHPAYYFYRIPLVAENRRRYPEMPRAHWQVKPGAEIILKDMVERDVFRVRHGWFVSLSYQWARRIGYGTWYDYDRLFYRDRINGIWYRSRIRDTHRVYLAVGLSYAFRGDFTLSCDINAGYFNGVDRNNAEPIGNYFAPHAVIPGYYLFEFYHHLYAIGRVQAGFPLPFWRARIQPGINVLYMPKRNEVIGIRRGVVTPNAVLAREYPKRVYTSASVSFSIFLGNVLPFFFDYTYAIDAPRADSAHELYAGRVRRGSHAVRCFVAGAFGKRDQAGD